MILHSATRSLVWAVLASTLTIVGCEVQSASKSEVRDPWKVKTIHRDDYRMAGSHTKDDVELNNGEKIADLGYNVELVGEILRQPKPPILLFFANDCLECEPGHFIIAYSPESRDKVELYHSGEHTQTTGGGDFQVVTSRTRLYYGSCLKDWRGIIRLKEERDLKFESSKWIVPYHWETSHQKVSIGATGELTLTDQPGRVPNRQELFGAVKQGRCHEVKGSGTFSWL